jgi:hypothetical protein
MIETELDDLIGSKCSDFRAAVLQRYAEHFIV